MKTLTALVFSLLLIGCEQYQDRVSPIKNNTGLQTVCFDGVQYIKYKGYSLNVKIDRVTLKPQTCDDNNLDSGGKLYE